jgi:hypothetical protein
MTGRAGESRRCQMEWNNSEKDQAGTLVAQIDGFLGQRRTVLSRTEVLLRLSEAAPLKEGLSWAGPGLLFIRHLFKELNFDEERVFRWRFEHKLVQALILDHYCKGSVPVTRGLGREVFGCSEDKFEIILRERYGGEFIVKAALGDSSGDLQQVNRLAAAAEEVRSRAPSSCPSLLSEERFILQERLEIEEEYRVHTLEDEVIPELTFGRYRKISTQDRKEPNHFVQEILDRLPSGLLAGMLYGWDVARNKAGKIFIIEANPAGFHPMFKRGFQCSYFFQEPSWGLPITAKLLYFVSQRYNVRIYIDIDEESASDDRYRYWWTARWLELFQAAHQVCTIADRIEDEGLSTRRVPAGLPFAERALIWALAGWCDTSKAVHELFLPSEIPDFVVGSENKC